ncbi:reverse transcriptase domain-containing protein [Tanacetum coccineum]|uniref:Reverse transcriptase domain-containing protein n=1 Tax=Tanacetum coccineum TaxID=301880 RepID=A0ABQ5ESH4_9ASTR
MRRTNRKCRIPIDLYPCQVEEKLIMRKVEGKWIMKKEIRMISKDGTITEFPRYTSSKEEEEEEEEEKEESEKKGSKEASEMESNSESLGYTASDNEVESDLESTARSEPKWKEMEDTCIFSITNNVNNTNANGGNGGNGNGGNNGCSYKGFLTCNPQDYDGKGGAVALTRWIEKMESARGREAAIGMTWVEFKALLMEEFCPSNEMEKLESEFWNLTMVGANHAGYTDRFYELAKLVPHLVTPESKRIGSSILKAGILNNEVILLLVHLTRSSKKREKDPNIVAGTFSLNDHFAIVLFDSGDDFSFISTKFAPLLNVKPSIVSLRYVIEVANGKKEEVDRIISDNKLELENSLFTIDLISLGHGSFDVIVGMN